MEEVGVLGGSECDIVIDIGAASGKKWQLLEAGCEINLLSCYDVADALIKTQQSVFFNLAKLR